MSAEQIAESMTGHWRPRCEWTPELRVGYSALLQTIRANLSYYQERERRLRASQKRT